MTECNQCCGEGKVTVPNTWTVDSRERRWARTYTEKLDIECDACEGSGSVEIVDRSALNILTIHGG